MPTKNKKAIKSALKAASVKVVNTPTVKIEHEKMEEPKPRIHLDSKVLPEIKNWSTGKEYTITLKVKMVSKNEGDEWGENESDRVRAGFKIKSARAK